MSPRDGSRTGRGRTSALVLVLGCLTLAHVGYRWHQGTLLPRGPTKVSTIAVGTAVSDLTLPVASDAGWRDGSLLLADDCQLVVAFDPSCPHCFAAANKERGVPAAQRLPATWVAEGDSLDASRYTALVGEGSRVARSDEVWKDLQVHGVPAAFLVDGQGVIRKVWGYRGDETRELLAQECGAGDARTKALASARRASHEPGR